MKARKPRRKCIAHGVTLQVALDDSATFLDVAGHLSLYLTTPAQARRAAGWLVRWAEWMEHKATK